MSPDSDYYKRVSDLIDELRPSLPSVHRPGVPRVGIVRQIAVLGVVALCLAALVTYVTDYAVARYRLAQGTALGTVDVARMVAIPQKSGKTEYEYAGAESLTCVRSIFPHFGHAPCWYARRNGGIQL